MRVVGIILGGCLLLAAAGALSAGAPGIFSVTGEAAASPRIVFDSNRSGTFGIYSMDLDGSDLQTVVDTPLHEMHPTVSPDGTLIAYSRAQSTERGAPSDIWLVEADGSSPRELVKNGSFPGFRSDGNAVYFERERSRVMVIAVDGTHEGEIFPNGAPPFAGRAVVLPRMSPDNRYLAFTSDLPQMWRTWIFDFKTTKATDVGQGCEPFWSPDSRSLIWVAKGDSKSKSGLYRFDVATGERTLVQDAGEPYGHEYFPSIGTGAQMLLWAACPADQHSHYTANYQIFTRPLNGGERRQITSDTFTNRWPALLTPSGEKSGSK